MRILICLKHILNISKNWHGTFLDVDHFSDNKASLNKFQAIGITWNIFSDQNATKLGVTSKNFIYLPFYLKHKKIDKSILIPEISIFENTLLNNFCFPAITLHYGNVWTPNPVPYRCTELQSKIHLLLGLQWKKAWKLLA